MTATTDKLQVMLEAIEIWYAIQGHKMWEYEHANLWVEYSGTAIMLIVLSPVALIVHTIMQLIALCDWITRIINR